MAIKASSIFSLSCIFGMLSNFRRVGIAKKCMQDPPKKDLGERAAHGGNHTNPSPKDHGHVLPILALHHF